ncbi:MAG: acyltransferase [Acidimicrobiia bacterium]|nr:acyltransferase [Acidimicrobiia bacterium]
MTPGGPPWRRAFNGLRSLTDPRLVVHLARLAHYVNYSHVSQRRLATIGCGARVAPNVSFANGERVQIGARSNIGARCHLWAGNRHGRVIVGPDCLLGPEVFLTASNYRPGATEPVLAAPTEESDVVIGAGAWLGARAMVLAGCRIGCGAIVGAGAVVTGDVADFTIVAGVPARVVGTRRPIGPSSSSDATPPASAKARDGAR